MWAVGDGVLNTTEVHLTPVSTRITLLDGSEITGKSTFIINGITRPAANVMQMAKAEGYRVAAIAPLTGANPAMAKTGLCADGKLVFVIQSVSSNTWLGITHGFDLNGNKVADLFLWNKKLKRRKRQKD